MRVSYGDEVGEGLAYGSGEYGSLPPAGCVSYWYSCGEDCGCGLYGWYTYTYGEGCTVTVGSGDGLPDGDALGDALGEALGLGDGAEPPNTGAGNGFTG